MRKPIAMAFAIGLLTATAVVTTAAPAIAKGPNKSATKTTPITRTSRTTPSNGGNSTHPNAAVANTIVNAARGPASNSSSGGTTIHSAPMPTNFMSAQPALTATKCNSQPLAPTATNCISAGTTARPAPTGGATPQR